MFESNKDKLIRLKAEYDELARIMSGLKVTTSYYIDRLVILKGKIAVLESRL